MAKPDGKIIHRAGQIHSAQPFMKLLNLTLILHRILKAFLKCHILTRM